MNTGFFWILLAMGLYGALHSLLASQTAKAHAERIFGAGVKRYYRILYSSIGLLSLIPVLSLLAVFPSTVIYRIPYPWRFLTLLLQAFGVMLAAAGVLQVKAWVFLGLAQLFQPPDQKPTDPLVVSGVYRWVRHPLYLGGLLAMWFMPVMTWNLLAFTLGTTLYLLVGMVFEERKLLVEFGDAYKEYRRHTPALFPIPKIRRKSS